MGEGGRKSPIVPQAPSLARLPPCSLSLSLLFPSHRLATSDYKLTASSNPTRYPKKTKTQEETAEAVAALSVAAGEAAAAADAPSSGAPSGAADASSSAAASGGEAKPKKDKPKKEKKEKPPQGGKRSWREKRERIGLKKEKLYLPLLDLASTPRNLKKTKKKPNQKHPAGAAAAAGKKKETKLGLSAPKATNFSDWYTEALLASEMVSYYDVSGCYILRPWSFAVWESITAWFDAKIKALGRQKRLFPAVYHGGQAEHGEGPRRRGMSSSSSFWFFLPFVLLSSGGRGGLHLFSEKTHALSLSLLLSLSLSLSLSKNPSSPPRSRG